MPPIAAPGHASYPSGHATQAYLLSLLMKEAMDGMIGAGFAEVDIVDQILARDPSSLLSTPDATLLVRLAERVARNREVLGVHYPSDSDAGMKLAGKIWTRLMTLPDMDRTKPKSLIRRAKQEWADFPRAKPAAGNGTLDLP